MLIILGVFTYIFSLIVPLVAFITALLMRQRWLKCLSVSAISYLITVCVVSNVFPLRLGEMVAPFEYDWMWFGFVSPPFYGFPASVESIFAAIKLYWESAVFGLLLGFIATLSIQSLRRLIPATVFILSTQVILVLAKILPSIITGGINKMYDISETIMAIIFYAIGYILARIVVKLSPELLGIFDGKRPENKQSYTDSECIKIRRKSVEISDDI